MTGTIKPIRSESAWFRVDGIRKGKGVVLLYPDRLVGVKVYAEYVCWVVMMLILDIVAYHIFHVIVYWLAPFFGVILGGVIGRAVDRWLAARMVASGAGNATVIPLDAISSLRTGYVQADMASALAGLGREVRATPLGLVVTPQALGNGT